MIKSRWKGGGMRVIMIMAIETTNIKMVMKKKN